MNDAYSADLAQEMPYPIEAASNVWVAYGGSILTQDPSCPRASAIVVADGVIAAIGDDKVADPYLGVASEVFRLDGRTVLPGFIDAHAHPVIAGVERLQCDLSGGTSPADWSTKVASYAEGNPTREWIVGGGWESERFPGGGPTADALDRLVASRPAILLSRDHHSAWVNSRALELAGINDRSEQPRNGRIELDFHGRPTGLLIESGAIDLVQRLVPRPTQTDFDEGLREAQHHLHSLGVVGWHDALVNVDRDGPCSHASYRRAQEQGWLSARVAGAMWWDQATSADEIAERIGRLVTMRADARQRGDRYTLNAVKIMQDGVMESCTASLLQPYCGRDGGVGTDSGLSFLEPALLNEVTAAIDRAGFDIHYHALGDRAVRDVLNALEQAIQANGPRDSRHQLAHLQLVDPTDISRFRALGATANIQALWAHRDPHTDALVNPNLGENRASRQYPFGDLRRAGARIVMGSDWPVSSADPISGIHVAVNRKSSELGAAGDPLGTDQELELDVALEAYTSGAAWVSRMNASGSLRQGAPADIVIMDRDLSRSPISELYQSQVARTFVDGTLVHQGPDDSL